MDMYQNNSDFASFVPCLVHLTFCENLCIGEKIEILFYKKRLQSDAFSFLL